MPWRIVARSDVFRPNAAALYGVEDVRGYESLVLDRFAETFPLWSRAQAASFNRVDDLASARPFLSLLNVGYAIGAPADPVPAGWSEQARGPELALFANPGALPRAFVPRAVRRVADPAGRLAAMAAVEDFSRTAFLGGAGPAEQENGEAALRLRTSGPDLVVEASVASRAFVATSLPDWPGWIAESNGRAAASRDGQPRVRRVLARARTARRAPRVPAGLVGPRPRGLLGGLRGLHRPGPRRRAPPPGLTARFGATDAPIAS